LTICNSELTPVAGSRPAGSRVRPSRTTNCEPRIAACDSPLHTACVNHRPWRARWICPPSLLRAPADFVVGKNYRLQDIQLSKIFRGTSPLGNLRWLGALSPGPPSLTHSRGSKAPLRSFAYVAGTVGSVAARPSFLSYGSARIAASRAVKNLLVCPPSLRATVDNLRLARLVACQP
jgi:hypothetical protein